MREGHDGKAGSDSSGGDSGPDFLAKGPTKDSERSERGERERLVLASSFRVFAFST